MSDEEIDNTNEAETQEDQPATAEDLIDQIDSEPEGETEETVEAAEQTEAVDEGETEAEEESAEQKVEAEAKPSNEYLDELDSLKDVEDEPKPPTQPQPQPTGQVPPQPRPQPKPDAQRDERDPDEPITLEEHRQLMQEQAAQLTNQLRNEFNSMLQTSQLRSQLEARVTELSQGHKITRDAPALRQAVIHETYNRLQTAGNWPDDPSLIDKCFRQALNKVGQENRALLENASRSPAAKPKTTGKMRSGGTVASKKEPQMLDLDDDDARHEALEAAIGGPIWER